ncbi:MAG: hypothetical protein ABEK36_06305 [Candidatus Aenigmatarchaeota archaeon]
MCSPEEVKCFNCGKWFHKEKTNAEFCEECEDWKCPHCGYCICDFEHEETKFAVRAMIDTYENFLNNKK